MSFVGNALSRPRLVGITAALWLVLAPAAHAQDQAPEGWLQAYQDQTKALAWPDFMTRLTQADVAFLGEQHDDPATHRLELAMLQALHRTLAGTRPLVLSLEMFETDTQRWLDRFLAGRIGEVVFDLAARPWPNYDRDYRPLIEYAKAHAIPVVAANVPRPIAASIARRGSAALDRLPAHDRQWVQMPDRYDHGEAWQRFDAVMRHHPGLQAEGRWRMYQAQCVKDATMARSIARTLEQGQPLVLHVQGRFHSDYRHGVPAYLARLRPQARMQVVTAIPVTPPAPAQAPPLADVVVYVQAPAKTR